MPFAPPSTAVAAVVHPGIAQTALRTIRAELTKLLTLRLSLYTAVATVLLTIAASWLLTILIDSALRRGRPEDTAGLEPGSAFMVILNFAQIGVILLTAWVVHQEADPGSLRSTLVAVPQRGFVFAAKAVIVAVAAAATGALSAFGSAAVRCLVVDCGAPQNAFAATSADALRMLLGVVAYWVLIALFTYALAILLRSGLAAMGIVLALTLAVSGYLARITTLARFLPDQAGVQLYAPSPPPADELGPLGGGLVLLAWVTAALVASVVAFRRQSVRH